MIITVSGPGRRRGLCFYVIVSAISLLLINLFLYFVVYNDAALVSSASKHLKSGAKEASGVSGAEDSTSGSESENSANDSESSESSSGSSSYWESASDLISSVTGGSSSALGKLRSVEQNIVKSINSNRRNQRLRSFLPLRYYEDETFSSLKLKEPSLKQFDRRLLPAYWIHKINKHLQTSGDSFLPGDFKLPFNWDLLNDYAVKIQAMKYFDKVVKNKMNCEQFRDIAPKNLPATFLENYCLNYNYEDPNFNNEYNVPFLVLRKIDQYLSDVDWRKLYGMMYSLTNNPIPDNVIFLGGVGSEGKSLLVPLEKVSNGKNNLASLGDQPLQSYYTTLTDEFIADQQAMYPSLSEADILESGISLYEEWIRFNELVGEPSDSEIDLNYFPSKPMVIGNSHNPELSLIDLDPEDFKFYLPDEEKKLASLIQNAPEGANTKQLENLKLWADLVLDPEWDEPWYYGIPSIESEHLDHYDWRFFSVFTLKEDQELHTAILHRLSRVWFRICAKFDVPSWMNHGPLIGWYWSGITLPYDYDLDLQMPIQSLHRISKFLNNTLVYDFSNEDEYVNDDIKIDNKLEMGIRSYLIDIDPLYFDRNQVRTLHNDLDLRLIDTETGIYIDLTAVSDFHSGNRYDLEEQKRYFSKSDYNGYRITVPTHWEEFKDESGNYKVDRGKGCVMKDEYVKKIEKYISEKKSTDSRLDDSPTKFLEGYIHDKHFHTYKLSELSPLVPTYYENSVSYMPSNWKKNTLIEYQGGKCLTNSYFQNHLFLEKLMLWVGYKECPIWDEKTGLLKEGMTLNQVANQCIRDNSKLEEQYKRSVHYSNLHNIYRDVMLKGQGDILKINDFETNITPLLKKFDGQLFVPEPFVERYLY